MNGQLQRWTGVAAAILIPVLVWMWLVAPGHARSQGRAKEVLQFETMVGNDPDQPINGIESDDLPWVIRSVEGQLWGDGSILLNIRGLVFADDPSVPPELRGTNDEETFRAVVSCYTEDENGDLVITNITSDEFPASETGNARIHDRLALPDPCIAPIVFVVGDEGEWLAVTGVGS